MYLGSGPPRAIFSKMIMIDNMLGLGLSMAAGVKGEYFDMKVELNDNKIYGEAPAPDCPPDGGYCFRGSKCGLMSSSFVRGSKPLHPTMSSPNPYHKLKSYGTWGGEAFFNRNEYIDFRARTREGGRQSILCLNPFASDYIPPHHFEGTKLINVDSGAMAFIMDPKPGWANPKDCVEFPCSAPKNILFSFQNTEWIAN